MHGARSGLAVHAHGRLCLSCATADSQSAQCFAPHCATTTRRHPPPAAHRPPPGPPPAHPWPTPRPCLPAERSPSCPPAHFHQRPWVARAGQSRVPPASTFLPRLAPPHRPFARLRPPPLRRRGHPAIEATTAPAKSGTRTGTGRGASCDLSILPKVERQPLVLTIQLSTLVLPPCLLRH